MQRLWRLVFLAPAALPLLMCQACASFGSYQSAQTLKRGRIVAEAQPNLQVYSVPAADGDRDLKVLPSVNLGIRWGIRQHLDAGLHLGGTGLAGDVKYELLQDETSTLSTGLGCSVRRRADAAGNGEWQYEVAAPVLYGFDYDDRLELVVAPRMALQMVWYEIDEDTFTFTTYFFPSVSVGGSWRLWKNRLRLHPELSLGYAVNLPHALDGATIEAGTPGFQVNAGLGVTFDPGWNNWYRGDGGTLPF